ncbi:signal peptidase I [Flavobacterium amnicola]|uniref:Signal peptidase I n=1 Tax=Flavobacterium amnicola TaxID=2506422 RepID=A0A4Q1K651_9FLAO|nr:signal peptidase I [Flavobacterium amnicola]
MDVFTEDIFYLFILAIIVFTIAINIMAMWKIFEKAGEKGWASIVPIYNIIVMLKITQKPDWWFLLFLIPFVNIVMSILVTNALSKKFGKYDTFVFGLILLPFIYYPILGFGDDEYGFD